MNFQNKISTELKSPNKTYQFMNEYEFGVTDDSKKDVHLNSNVTLDLDYVVKKLKHGKKDFYHRLFNYDLIHRLKLNFKMYKNKKGNYKYQFDLNLNVIDPKTNETLREMSKSYNFKVIKDRQVENLAKLGYAVHWSFDDYSGMLFPECKDDDTRLFGMVYFATLDHDLSPKKSKIIKFEDDDLKFTLDGEKYDISDWIAEPYFGDTDVCYGNENPHDHLGLFVSLNSYHRKWFIDNPKKCKFKPGRNDHTRCIFVLHKPNK